MPIDIPNACTTSANQALGTTSLEALSCNLGFTDNFANTTALTVTNRVGLAQDSVAGIQAKAFAAVRSAVINLVGVFGTASTIVNPNDAMLQTGVGYWYYTGTLPHSVSSGDTPVAPAWTPVTVSALQNLLGLTAPSDLAQRHRIKTTVAEIATGVFNDGDRLEVTDRYNAPFDLVSGGVANGIDLLSAGPSKTAVLSINGVRVNIDHLGASQLVDCGPICQRANNMLPVTGGVIEGKSASYNFDTGFTLKSKVGFCGSGMFSTVLSTTSAIDVITYASGGVAQFVASCWIKQNGTIHTGRGIVGDGTSWSGFSYIRVEGFDTNVKMTKGLYHYHNRPNYIEGRICCDYSNPSLTATDFWNTDWFNNQHVFDLPVFDGGGSSNSEYGLILQGAGCTVNSPTAQRVSISAMRFIGNLARLNDPMRGLTLNSPYVEGAPSALEFINADNVFFSSGFDQAIVAAGDKFLTLDGSNVTIGAGIFHSDTWTTKFDLKNGSTLRGFIGGTGSELIDSTSKYIQTGKSEHFRKYKSGSLNNGQSITLSGAIPTTDGNYTLVIGVSYNGVPFEVQSWSIWRSGASTYQIRQSTNGSTRVVTVSGSGSDLIVTNSQAALAMVFTCTVFDQSAMSFN